jgi:hypothetical protein
MGEHKIVVQQMMVFSAKPKVENDAGARRLIGTSALKPAARVGIVEQLAVSPDDVRVCDDCIEAEALGIIGGEACYSPVVRVNAPDVRVHAETNTETLRETE